MAQLKDTRIYGSLVVDNGLLVSGVTTNVAGVTTYPGGIIVSGISTLSTTLIGSATSTGTASQPLQVTGSAYVSGSVGLGTTNPGSKLTVNGAVQIQQDSGSNNRLVFRGEPASSYRWNIDNYSSSNNLRIFREDNVTAGSGAVYAGITSTGNFQFDSGYGSAATAYGCRAWVNFDGSGTTSTNQTIRGSGNVSTVFKNGTGDYTVNFTTSMPDANYSIGCIFKRSGITEPIYAYVNSGLAASCRIISGQGSFTAYDTDDGRLSFFR
jgi:hypothetical protein